MGELFILVCHLLATVYVRISKGKQFPVTEIDPMSSVSHFASLDSQFISSVLL